MIGCYFGIEFPKSIRIRPGRGDGGVDILVPVGERLIDVYQLKHHPNKINWSHVEDSLARVSTGSWNRDSIRNWHLVIPHQPTQGNLEKLRSFSEALSFGTCFFGEDKLAGFAARHPEVADYYLGDGQAQLKRTIRDWGAVFDRMAESESPRIEDAEDRLIKIVEALRSQDPHFHYKVEVGPIDPIVKTPHELFAGSHSQALGLSTATIGEHEITCQVIPRYPAALEDGCDRLEVRFLLTPAAHGKVREVIEMGGKPVELSRDDITSFDGPDVGRRTTSIPARLLFYPPQDTRSAFLRLVVSNLGERPLAIRFNRTLLSGGTAGSTSTWTSPGGVISLKVVYRQGDSYKLTIKQNIVPGARIVDCASDLGLLWALRKDAEISLANEAGPISPLAETFSLIDDFIDRTTVALLDALRVVQDHTRTGVIIPESFDSEGFLDILKAAALLEWLPTSVDLTGMSIESPDVDTSDSPISISFGFKGKIGYAFPCERLSFQHQSVDLENTFIFQAYLSAQVTEIVQVSDSTCRLKFVPGHTSVRIDKRVRGLNSPENDSEFSENDLLSTEQLIAELRKRGNVPSAR